MYVFQVFALLERQITCDVTKILAFGAQIGLLIKEYSDQIITLYFILTKLILQNDEDKVKTFLTRSQPWYVLNMF